MLNYQRVIFGFELVGIPWCLGDRKFETHKHGGISKPQPLSEPRPVSGSSEAWFHVAMFDYRYWSSSGFEHLENHLVYHIANFQIHPGVHLGSRFHRWLSPCNVQPNQRHCGQCRAMHSNIRLSVGYVPMFAGYIPCHSYIIWLVVSNIFLFSTIYRIILPID